MSQENVGVVKSAYAAFGKGDVPNVLGAMDPQIVWTEAENFPYADRNPYVGPTAILEGVFLRILGDWDDFKVVPEEFFDAGDTVVARGRYDGVHKKTGSKIHAQFAHFWTLRAGKIVSCQQHADTLQVAKAAGA
jgi:ketosteroid isomerase-like protein